MPFPGRIFVNDRIAPKVVSMARILLCCVLSLIAAENLLAGTTSPHAKKAIETIQQLRAIGIPSQDSSHPAGVIAPPEQVPGLLRTLNQELKDLIIEDLNDQSLQQFSLDDDEVMDKLRAAGWDESPNTKWTAYGEIEDIIFDQHLEYSPSLVVVTTKLWVPCGSSDPDSAIYVFAGSGRHWKLILERTADFNPTGESEGSGLSYKLSPPDSHGNWFMVVGRVPPNCRKKHTLAQFEALRPGEEPAKPVVLASGKESINTFFDPPFRIEVGPSSFSIKFGGGWISNSAFRS